MASLHYTASTLFSLQKHMMPAAMSRGVRNDGVTALHESHLLWRKINRSLKKGRNFVNREETKMRHVTMVSKFPWISTNYDRKKKTKKLTRMNFLCIALRDKTIAHTFLPSLDSANGRLCQEKFLRSRIFATMVTWRHTSPLYSDLAKLFNWRIHWMTNCANSVRAGSPVRIREKFWRRSSHTLMAKPSQSVIIFFFLSHHKWSNQKYANWKEKKRKKESHTPMWNHLITVPLPLQWGLCPPRTIQQKLKTMESLLM